jgi:hypothetical protein
MVQSRLPQWLIRLSPIRTEEIVGSERARCPGTSMSPICRNCEYGSSGKLPNMLELHSRG